MPGSQLPEIHKQDGVTIVAYASDCERITEDRIPETLDAMLAAVDGERPVLLVDLSHVQFFGSSFIEVLFRVWNRVQQQHEGRFALCGLTSHCAEVIEVSNLDKLWQVFPTREAALASLQQPA